MKQSQLFNGLKKSTLSLIFLLHVIVSFSQTKEEKIDNLLSAYNKLYQFNGTALIAQDGKILVNKVMDFSK
jgi:hypothetical protein